MKKLLSLMLTFTILFSVACFHTNAAEISQSADVVTGTQRIVVSDDELLEKTGVEKIILPEGYVPAVCIYYSRDEGEFILPDNLTVVFEDGYETSIPLEIQSYLGYYSNSGIGEAHLPNGEKVFVRFYFMCSPDDYTWSTYIKVKKDENVTIKTDFNNVIITEQPFSANLKHYFQSIDGYFYRLVMEGAPFWNDKVIYIYNISSFFNDIVTDTKMLILSVIG
ncbi:MAG: hypothetical protein IJM10_01690 [Clostridia bacterium]|nr:hypothetical protein [Clostridia bacterium]